MANTHAMTGAPLEQPVPAPKRIYALWDRDQDCIEHSTAYQGNVPCTGAYACNLCGTAWDDDGRAYPRRSPTDPRSPERDGPACGGIDGGCPDHTADCNLS